MLSCAHSSQAWLFLPCLLQLAPDLPLPRCWLLPSRPVFIPLLISAFLFLLCQSLYHSSTSHPLHSPSQAHLVSHLVALRHLFNQSLGFLCICGASGCILHAHLPWLLSLFLETFIRTQILLSLFITVLGSKPFAQAIAVSC